LLEKKRPERVDVTPTASVTQSQQPGPTDGPGAHIIRCPPVSATTTGKRNGRVVYHTTVLKIGEREWKRHTDTILLEGTEAHY